MDGLLVPEWRQAWSETALSDRDEFARGIADLGFTNEAAHQLLEQYDKDVAGWNRPVTVSETMRFYGVDGRANYIEEQLRRRLASAKRALSEILQGRELRTEQSVQLEVRFPLFWLTSPLVKGSKVRYKDEVSKEKKATWSLRVLGTGMGAVQSASVTYSSELASANGDCKLVFVPVLMDVELVGVYHGGKRISGGIRSQMAPITHKLAINNGIESRNASDSLQAMTGVELVSTRFPLSGDQSGEIHTFTRTETAEGMLQVSVGIDAFGVRASSKAEVRRKAKYEIHVELPAGHDYLMERAATGGGVWWRVE